MLKKNKIICIILGIVLVGSCVAIMYLFDKNKQGSNSEENNVETKKLINNEPNKKDLNQNITENNNEITTNEQKEQLKTKDNITSKQKSSTDTNSQQTKKQNTDSSKNNSSQSNEPVKKEEPKKEESAKQEPEPTKNKYIGVPDPNSFYYSFHHGKIEYNSMDSCLAATERVLEKDTEDILNAWCMDVVDGEGTVLGEYLYVKCSSGNCDKYK